MGTFFLTAVDTERLKIRGSRDPLGLVPIWGAFGREVVGNLTTASNSARGFSTLLLGLYFAERVAAGEADRDARRLHAFLTFEQLAGYARFGINDDTELRGITLVKKRWPDASVRVGGAVRYQILSNQKTYGLWGLFITPAVDSGLVISKENVLTATARRLVEEHYLPLLRRDGRDEGVTIEAILRRDATNIQPRSRHGGMIEALAEILAPKFRAPERRVLHESLVIGPEQKTHGRQKRLFELIDQELVPGAPFDHASLRKLIDAAREDRDAALRYHLVRIRDMEALLVAAANLFGFLQNRDGATIPRAALDLQKVWRAGIKSIRRDALEEMAPHLEGILGDAKAGQRLVALGVALQEGAFETAVDLILDHNEFVMTARNGSRPWVQRDGNRLAVRYRDGSQRQLLTPSEIASAWRSTFYIDPLKQVADQLRRAR